MGDQASLRFTDLGKVSGNSYPCGTGGRNCNNLKKLKPTLSVPSLKAHIEVLMLLAVKRVDGCHKLSQRSVEAQQLLKGQFQQPAP